MQIQTTITIQDPIKQAISAARNKDYEKCRLYVENAANIMTQPTAFINKHEQTMANAIFSSTVFKLIDYFMNKEEQLDTDQEDTIHDLWHNISLSYCCHFILFTHSLTIENPIIAFNMRIENGELEKYDQDGFMNDEYMDIIENIEQKMKLFNNKLEQTALRIFHKTTRSSPTAHILNLASKHDLIINSTNNENKPGELFTEYANINLYDILTNNLTNHKYLEQQFTNIIQCKYPSEPTPKRSYATMNDINFDTDDEWGDNN